MSDVDLVALAKEALAARGVEGGRSRKLLAQGYLDAVECGAQARASLADLAKFYTECELALHEIVPEGGDASHFRNAVATVVAHVKALRAEVDRWRNQFICVGCESLRACVDEDGCCTACGADCLVVEDGKLSGAGSVKDALADADALAVDKARLRDVLVHVSTEIEATNPETGLWNIVNEMIYAVLEETK